MTMKKMATKKSNAALQRELDEANYHKAFYAHILHHVMKQNKMDIVEISHEEYNKWVASPTGITIKHRLNEAKDCLEVMSESEERH